jgi:hypothetical protein
MTNSTVANESNLPLVNTPLIYADTLVGLAIGPFVSKMILGVESPGQQSTPSLQVSMPTNALHDLAKHILELLQNADAQKNIVEGHKNFQAAISLAD